MPGSLANEGLWERAISILNSQSGSVQTLEFMAMLSRQPFDYQRWRDEQFGGMSVEEILAQAKVHEK
jgi:hypothetical protein